ncbi:MAG: MBL fold metallo-hydrolase [Eubacteriales bacterium]|nr:MBL fold metallo-hydrolase [Eubacteriales bacterium]
MKTIQRPIVSIAPRTWLLSEYKLVNSYLLEGDDLAMLIDGGAGVGNLAEDARALTPKPILFVATHGDGDHIAAAGCFDKAYLHPLDQTRASMFPLAQMASYMVRSRGPVRNPETPVEDLLALIPKEPLPPLPKFLPMEEGQVFQLGGRPVEVIHTPGHSDGSVCLLDKKNRLLFTGDACNDRLLVCGEDRDAGLRQSLNTFEKLWARRDEFDYICQGHDALDKADKSFILDYIEAIQALLAGAEGTHRTDAMHSGIMYPHKKVMVWYNLDMKMDDKGKE